MKIWLFLLLLLQSVVSFANESDYTLIMRVTFNKPVVNYQDSLYIAIEEVIKRKPDASFLLVGVDSAYADQAKTEVTKAARQLLNYGIEKTHISTQVLYDETLQDTELRILAK